MGMWSKILSLVGVVGLFLATGCQVAPSVSAAKLIRHQAVIDYSGLKDAQVIQPVKARIAPPQNWDTLKLKSAAVYTDAQWRSPSHTTGVGIAYVKMPLPFSASTLIWLAKHEYSKRSEDGKLLGQWTDELGRPWFEAENKYFHVRGYVVVKGFDAWFIYCGYKTAEPPNAAELGLAARSLETIVPTPIAELPEAPSAAAN